MGDCKGAKSAIIIGAGVGGVALAARLAKAGLNVTLLEKNDFIGGRCSLIHHDGHRFDQGPSLVLVPELFKETFEDLDTSMEAEGIQLVKCEPNYTLHFHSGDSVSLSTDISLMKDQIEKWEGVDGFEKFLDFLKESHRHYEVSLEHVMHQNYTSILSLLRPEVLSNLLSLHPFQSLYSRACKHFTSPQMRKTFTFASMYTGMSPYDAPATYSLLQYTEFARGIWYPIGGFAIVPIKLAEIAQRFGATIRLSSPVKSLLFSDDGKRVSGVVTASGESLEADIVVCNADLVYAYDKLLPSPRLSSLGKIFGFLDDLNPLSSSRRNVLNRTASCSTISFYWSLSRPLPRRPKHAPAASNFSSPAEGKNDDYSYFSAHNIFLADAYKRSFDQIFKEHTLPTDPSFYINVPSMLDDTAAPGGCDTVVVLVPVGHLLQREVDSEEGNRVNALVNRARTQVLETIKTRMGIDLSKDGWIKHEIVNNPIVWKNKFNLDRGAALGLSLDLFNTLCFRPCTQHSQFKNMYFVGASTHPGTGVPVVLAGAKITAEQILSNHLPPNEISGFKSLQGNGHAVGHNKVVSGPKSKRTSFVEPFRLLIWLIIVSIIFFWVSVTLFGVYKGWRYL
ncbi:uncharacterized protein EI90DRAFT_3146669 [Cantharellus anzutake]|uniref:uncharacterized protein n=1 Tax=Cantharellus anzutake TaxID=1750568 RepID=UPI001904B945|nr:uncharacterized protein EI90DRAFT_3146669 [Cantharellus anzutake]KAF8325397.1 hypothetical protein EI90DRAFT_3146669 [Cantharellus anzutake]